MQIFLNSTIGSVSREMTQYGSVFVIFFIAIFMQLFQEILSMPDNCDDGLSKNKHKNCEACWISLITTWSIIIGTGLGFGAWFGIKKYKEKVIHESRQMIIDE